MGTPDTERAPDRKGLSRQSFRPRAADLLSGLINAVICVPNGLAMAALTGVPPMHGLYAATVGSGVGALFTSTHVMIITTTSAAAVTAGQTVASFSSDERPAALFLLAILTGILLVVFGLLKVGQLVRYVPYSVMQGFLFSIALVLVLGQFPDMVGYEPESSNTVVAFGETVISIDGWAWQAAVLGALALAIAAFASRTRIGAWANLLALVIPTALMVVLNWTRPEQVVDVSPIPRGLPPVSLPDLSLLNLDFVLGALALAGIIIVQSVGITESTRNRDRSQQSSSTDITAQGIANVATGFLSGIPIAASVGQTALNRATNARTRWTNIFCALWLLVFIFLLAGLIEIVPMAVLAGLMVYAGIGAMDFRRARSIFRTGWSPALAFIATLAIASVVSVPAAVIVGLVLALVMNMVQSSQNFTIREVTVDEDGHLIEGPPPTQLPGNTITLLNVYGDLFFAAAKRLKENLPEVGSAQRPVVTIRFRGQHTAGATLVDVITDYARKLKRVNGRLYLAGMEREALRQIERAGRVPIGDVVYLVPATDRVGEATEVALRHAQLWLAEHGDDSDTENAGFRVRAVQIIEPDDVDQPATEPIDITASEILRQKFGPDEGDESMEAAATETGGDAASASGADTHDNSGPSAPDNGRTETS